MRRRSDRRRRHHGRGVADPGSERVERSTSWCVSFSDSGIEAAQTVRSRWKHRVNPIEPAGPGRRRTRGGTSGAQQRFDAGPRIGHATQVASSGEARRWPGERVTIVQGRSVARAPGGRCAVARRRARPRGAGRAAARVAGHAAAGELAGGWRRSGTARRAGPGRSAWNPAARRHGSTGRSPLRPDRRGARICR